MGSMFGHKRQARSVALITTNDELAAVGMLAQSCEVTSDFREIRMLRP